MLNYKIYIIRHGLTQGNLDGKYIGVTDLPLCIEGIEGLKRLQKESKYPPADIVYSSSLRRCRETAELLYPKAYTVPVDELMECNFGEFENRDMDELKRDSRFLEWMENPANFVPEGGESPEAFRQRIAAGIDFVVRDMMKNKTTSAALITHGGVIMEILSRYGLPERDPMDWFVENGKGYTLVTSAQGWARDKKFEVFTAIPSGEEKEANFQQYTVYDIPEIQESDE